MRSGGVYVVSSAMDEQMAEPVLKWAGGKRQILTQIRDCFPPEDEISRYHEPFFGGGAIFFKETYPYSASINDINARLMNFYWVVREHPDDLIEHNETHEGNEEYYYNARDRFNAIRNDVERFDHNSEAIKEASLLLYLNRNCFNGLYRENSSGEFNVPYGSYSNPDWIQSSRIIAASDALDGVEIFNEDFEYVVDEAEEGDLVYFDPPYEPVSTTSSFVEYHNSAFGQEEQQRLADKAVELHNKGVNVVMSNSPPMEELYHGLDEFEIRGVGARRSINSNAEDRGEVKEIIVTNVQNTRADDSSLSDFQPETA